jgi:hypothetical protein
MEAIKQKSQYSIVVLAFLFYGFWRCFLRSGVVVRLKLNELQGVVYRQYAR